MIHWSEHGRAFWQAYAEAITDWRAWVVIVGIISLLHLVLTWLK